MRVVEAAQVAGRWGSEGAARAWREVSVTGVGMVTALGGDAVSTWDALLRGHYVADHARAKMEPLGAEPRVVALARRAAREAAAEAGWPREMLEDRGTGLIVGTSKGPIERWLTPLLYMEMAPYIVGGLDPAGIGEVAAVIGADLGVVGPRLTISAACASGLHALIRGVMMVRGGEVDRVIIVAAEASLHPLFVGSFQRLGVLAKAGAGCRPFDQDRDGFVMSEAAAAVCVEVATESAGSAGGLVRPSIRVERFAVGGDATHLTGGHPDGKTLKAVLGRVIDGREVDLIHAHGTGTVANDEAELRAIEASLAQGNDDPPSIYSHKGALGHSLGAAGLVAVVINCLAHRQGIVPGNVRTLKPVRMRGLEISANVRRRPIRRSVAVAAGFGGAVAGVALVSAAVPSDVR